MRMLAKKVANCLYNNAIIGQDMIEICEYGVELVLAGAVNIIVIMLVSILLDYKLYGIVFLMVLIPTRTFMGGYHATTHFKFCVDEWGDFDYWLE